jgi:hypothetical protein
MCLARSHPPFRLVVAIAEIGGGRHCGHWRQVRPAQEETAASLVGAAMASVLLFPITALALRRMALPQHHARSETTMPDKFA